MIEHKTKKVLDLTGLRFGKLTVIRYSGRNNNNTLWFCKCECGTEVVRKSHGLRSGVTTSCGCIKHETIRQARTKHGRSQSLEYSSYSNAKSRCNDESCGAYFKYGAKGVKFLFASFEQFFEEIGPRPSAKHSLDRIDCSGHYEPGNVRWSTNFEQANNTTVNRLVTIEGVTKTLSQWCGGSSTPLYKRVHGRISHGWCAGCAMKLPYGSHKPANCICGYVSN